MFGIGGTDPIFALLAAAGFFTFWYRFCCWSRPTTMDWIWLGATAIFCLTVLCRFQGAMF
jgi:hypothetical protein